MSTPNKNRGDSKAGPLTHTPHAASTHAALTKSTTFSPFSPWIVVYKECAGMPIPVSRQEPPAVLGWREQFLRNPGSLYDSSPESEVQFVGTSSGNDPAECTIKCTPMKLPFDNYAANEKPFQGHPLGIPRELTMEQYKQLVTGLPKHPNRKRCSLF